MDGTNVHACTYHQGDPHSHLIARQLLIEHTSCFPYTHAACRLSEFHGNFHTSQYSKPVDPVHVAIPLRPDRPRDGAPLSTLRLLEDAKVQQTVAQTRIQPGSDLHLIGGILRDLVGEDVAITGQFGIERR